MRLALAPVVLAALLAACAQPKGGAGPAVRELSYADLDGWSEDDHAAALAAFIRSCSRARGNEGLKLTAFAWVEPCVRARTVPIGQARGFFESEFRPVLVAPGAEALFTGYYEPELAGARQRGGRHQYPIYAPPPDLPAGAPGPSRAEIGAGALDGKGLELFWLDDPVDVFFLQVQGSGRIRLPDGETVRVGFAAHNNRDYVSVGKAMEAEGILASASADAIRDWVRQNPERGREMLNRNPRYVFFRVLNNLDPELGPIGAVGAPLTPLRSVAVDPKVYPLGAPMWVETAAPMGALRRVMIAQDVGGAIKGAQRGDIFFGTGQAAGAAAGRMKAGGRMVALLPRRPGIRVAGTP